MTENQVIEMLGREVGKSESQQAWATANGMSPAHLCDVLYGRRRPAKAILAALGLEKIVTYRRVRK
jgi:hypothetical protein